MSDTVATILIVAAAAYVGVGCLVAAMLVTGGLERLDATARHSPWGFRLIVAPGLIALWPWALRRWSRSGGGKPHDA